MADDKEFGLEFEFETEGTEQKLELDRSGAPAPVMNPGKAPSDGDFEFDASGMEPGLELDRSVLESPQPVSPPQPYDHEIPPVDYPPEPDPVPPPQGPSDGAPQPRPRERIPYKDQLAARAGGGNTSPGGTAAPPAPAMGAGALGEPGETMGGASGATPTGGTRVRPQRPERSLSELEEKKPGSSMGTTILVAVALMAVLAVGAMLLGGGEKDDFEAKGPAIALQEGERAFHQGDWVTALEAFRRLNRFPASEEAQSVRERGLEEEAFDNVMEAEPSPEAARRLERLSALYPQRKEIRTRLGEVRKALSSGARSR